MNSKMGSGKGQSPILSTFYLTGAGSRMGEDGMPRAEALCVTYTQQAYLSARF